jgi:5,10-methylenetetrahydromethanopterin reductase
LQRVRLGPTFAWAGDLEEFLRRVALAEECGMGVIGVSGSVFQSRDEYVSLAVAARVVERATLGPMVTTPFLRDPAATAIAASSLYELTEGRFVLGFGAGGSVPVAIGRTMANRTELREYLSALRALFEGEAITWNGLRVNPPKLASRVPVYLSADGPVYQRLAVELCDGVIVPASMQIEFIAEHVARIHSLQRELGRTIDVWGRSWWNIRDTREEAFADAVAQFAQGYFKIRPGRATARLPEHLAQRARELQPESDPDKLLLVGREHPALLQDPELSAHFVRGSAVAGTPEEVAATVQALADLGMTCIISPLNGNPDPEGTVRRMAAAVRPAGLR